MTGIVGPSFVRCCGCNEKITSRDGIHWKALVSTKTGLYFPGEPFCREECYAMKVNHPDGAFAEPTAEQKRAFVRTMTPGI